jgi:hypothetical protein
MLNTPVSATTQTVEGREARIQELLDQVRAAAEPTLRHLAEQLVDAPDAELFGPLEYSLRDQVHALAATIHQTGLTGRKKRGM